MPEKICSRNYGESLLTDHAAHYEREITDHSFRELEDLAVWAKHRGPDLWVIGGWAAWHYHQGLGSRDIDVIFAEPTTIDKFLYEYYKEHGFQPYGGLLSKQYRKPLHVEGKQVYIDIDAASFNDSRPFKKDPTKNLPYSLVKEYCKPWNLGRASIFVPIPELLLLQKLKAHQDRTWDLRHKAIHPLDIAHLRGKIWKDEQDIINLAPTVADWSRVWRIAEDHQCRVIVEEPLHEILRQQER